MPVRLVAMCARETFSRLVANTPASMENSPGRSCVTRVNSLYSCSGTWVSSARYVSPAASANVRS